MKEIDFITNEPVVEYAPELKVTITKTGENVRYVEMKCSNPKCPDPIDHVKLFPEEPVPPTANCGVCHAGFKMSPSEMVTRHIGLFPTGKVETFGPEPLAT